MNALKTSEKTKDQQRSRRYREQQIRQIKFKIQRTGSIAEWKGQWKEPASWKIEQQKSRNLHNRIKIEQKQMKSQGCVGNYRSSTFVHQNPRIRGGRQEPYKNYN